MLRSEVDVRPVQPGDIEFVAEHMRVADIAEVYACGHAPLEALRFSVDRSAMVRTATVCGRPAAIFGVAPLGSVLDPRGAPWLLGTDDVPLAPRALARLARFYTREMLGAFPHLVNSVHARNAPAVAWLTHMGFRLGVTYNHRVTGEPFTIFEMRRK